MPQKFERYNRFMKFWASNWSNDKKLDTGDGWTNFDWDTKCEICKKVYKRSQLVLRDGKIRCKECLNG